MVFFGICFFFLKKSFIFLYMFFSLSFILKISWSYFFIFCFLWFFNYFNFILICIIFYIFFILRYSYFLHQLSFSCFFFCIFLLFSFFFCHYFLYFVKLLLYSLPIDFFLPPKFVISGSGNYRKIIANETIKDASHRRWMKRQKKKKRIE